MWPRIWKILNTLNPRTFWWVRLKIGPLALMERVKMWKIPVSTVQQQRIFYQNSILEPLTQACLKLNWLCLTTYGRLYGRMSDSEVRRGAPVDDRPWDTWSNEICACVPPAPAAGSAPCIYNSVNDRLDWPHTGCEPHSPRPVSSKSNGDHVYKQIYQYIHVSILLRDQNFQYSAKPIP